MPVHKGYAKLGLFLAITLVAMLATGLFFLQRSRSHPLLEVVTYSMDNVSGLDVSSPVRFRGLTVGRVSQLSLHPADSLIEINFELYLDRIRDLGGNVLRVQQLADSGLFSQMRAQVIGNPVTGEAYLLLDRPDNPPPPLGLDFAPSRPYIPIMPSPLSAIQDRLPEVMDHVEQTLRTLAGIVARMPDSLERTDRFFTNVEKILRDTDLPSLSADTRNFYSTTSAQMTELSAHLDHVLGEGGTVDQLATQAQLALKSSELPETTAAAREASQQTVLAADDLRRSLPSIRESLEELRALARMLQDQPESMVYGPRPAKGKSQ